MKLLFLGRRKNRPTVNKRAFIECLHQLANKHKAQIHQVCYVFMNDEELCDINRRFLNHDTYTDIITFDLSSAPDNIEGEIYISLDRVTENALIYGTSIKEEFLRVMFHGVLHLLGYKDKSKKEKLHMRKAEDDCLILYRETNTHVSHETKE